MVPNQICNFVYTSGTTGNPKAVMLTHDNMTYAVQVGLSDAILDYKDQLDGQERLVSYLPLSHVAAQYFDLIVFLFYNVTVYFAKPDALSGSLLDTLKIVRPTIFFAVPRIYEKMEEKLKSVAM